MGDWLYRRLESLLDNAIFAGVVAVIFAVWSFLKTLPAPIIALVAIIIFAVVLFILRVVLSFLDRRKRTKTILSEPKDIPSWLEQLASQDLDNLKYLIKVEVRQIEFDGLNDRVPHFRLFVRLINASIFRVKLSRCDGYIQLSGSQCAPPQLDRLPELEHGTGGRVELHQSLNDKTAKWLMEQAATNTHVNIVCIACQFVFQVTSHGYNKQVEIPLNEGGLNCVPKRTVVIFNGNIGTVTN